MQMKPALWTLCTLLTATSPHALGQEPATEYYYGIEANGVLCGYAKIEVSPLLLDGRQLTLLKHEVVTQSSALGNQVDSRIRLTYHLDPLTGRFTYHDSAIEQGSTRLGSAIRIEGDTARCTSTLSDQETLVALPKDAILENTVFFPHLKTDFAERGLETKMYSIFEVRGFQMQDVTYSRVGRETVELAGAQYDAIVLTRLSKQTGLKTKHWIDTRSGLLLKAVQQGNRTSYLADASIVDRIERAEITGTLIAKVGVAIPNFMTLHHMKVNATMEPSGLQVTPESLNLPGQRFTGAVRENLIEGIFEIEPPRYDGTNAPAFPAGAGPDESLAPYLKAEGLIK